MLMEHREEISHGTENFEKIESLDLQSVCKEKPWVSPVKKRSRGRGSGGRGNGLKRKLVSEEQVGGRKRIKKEVLLTSLSSDRNLGKGQLSSAPTDSGAGEGEANQKENGGGVGAGLGGVGLKLDGDVNIPKRPLDLVRRKKVEVDLASNQEGGSGSRASLGVGEGKLNDNGDGKFNHLSNSNGKLAINGESEGALSDGVVAKVKRKKNSDDRKENRKSKSDLLQHVKNEKSQSSVHNNGDSAVKKPRRTRKKQKEVGPTDVEVSKEVNQSLNENSVESQDDEENLEANAARMLSSRFDPSCTGFSSGGKSSRMPHANGVSAMLSSNGGFDITAHPNSLAESDLVSSDGDARALRSRDQQKGKGLSKQRRQFYEVLSKDMDCYWVLNRKIKVFWPLDKSWYVGHVTGYDPEKKLHHVKYDDREEEWIDLENERFKLLLYLNEVPGKVVRKLPTTQNKHSGKGKSDGSADKDQTSINDMESEPIISWLGRSTSLKSPLLGSRKRQRTLHESASSVALGCEGKGELIECLEVGSSGRDVDNLVCGSALSLNGSVLTSDVKLPVQKVLSARNKSPIVYFRRRFQKKGEQYSDIHAEDLYQLSKELPTCGTASEYVDSFDFGLDMMQFMAKSGRQIKSMCSKEFIWDIDDSGLLKLAIPVTSLKVFRCQLSIPLPYVDISLFGGPSFMFLLQHGALISVWPMIRLEMLFVDNTVGLWFVLFEGCLMQAVSFVSRVLVIFQSIQKGDNVGQDLPLTSIRFQFSGLQSLERQLVFTSYNFSEVVSSKWSYLDKKLNKHCVFTKQLPPSECTYENILALKNGCQLPLTHVSEKPTSVMSIQKRSRQQKLIKSFKHSSFVELSQVASDSNDKLPPSALSFTTAPTFFLNLHLKLLMERSISSSSFRNQDPICLMDCSEHRRVVGAGRIVAEDQPLSSSVSVGVTSGPCLSSEACFIPDLGHNVLSKDNDGVTAKPSLSSVDISENEVKISQSDKRADQVVESENCSLLGEASSADNQLSPVHTEVGCGRKAKMTIEIPSLISSESVTESDVQNVQHPADPTVTSNDSAMRSPTPTPQSLFHTGRIGDVSPSASACLSPAWSDGKQEFPRNGFGSGPKKPRTQVSYSMLVGGNDYNSKNKFHHGKGFSHKRIRKANQKKTSEAFGSSERNMDSIFCDVNVLVTVGDRGWRECGARVVLELVDHNEWRLGVKISGDTKYSYKAHQFLQPGSTNRYTHAMMWKGGKDWILEFTDRSQWAIFKEMHEECYNRNLRAACVKNIPIPGVRLIDENNEIVPEVPYMRPSSSYYRQLETDIDIALNPSRVLYDMDSDDEQWIMRRRGLDFNECGCGDVSDDMFEKTMDAFEKFAFAKKCDHFSLDELEEVMAGFGPLDAIIIIYEHWREKRQIKGMPLIRHLQPPLWEKYQQQVKEWEQVVPRGFPAPSSGCSEKSTEKPAMFAFCLKPRGLEVSNRGSKQRSQKKLPVGVLSNGVPGDLESFHSLVGRRLNGFALGDERLVYSAYNQGASDSSPVLQGSTRGISPRDSGSMGYFSLNNDGFDRNYYSRPYKNKSKKLCFVPPSNDQFASYSQRAMGKRSIGHMWNMGSSEGHSQMIYPSDGFRRHNFEQLDPSELDEFRLRDAASAARHAFTIARMKRENAQRMLCLADLAMQKAVAAIMTADAVKASYEEPNDDDQMTG